SSQYKSEQVNHNITYKMQIDAPHVNEGNAPPELPPRHHRLPQSGGPERAEDPRRARREGPRNRQSAEGGGDATPGTESLHGHDDRFLHHRAERNPLVPVGIPDSGVPSRRAEHHPVWHP